jgi:hypothetical protein
MEHLNWSLSKYFVCFLPYLMFLSASLELDYDYPHFMEEETEI